MFSNGTFCLTKNAAGEIQTCGILQNHYSFSISSINYLSASSGKFNPECRLNLITNPHAREIKMMKKQIGLRMKAIRRRKGLFQEALAE